MRCDVSDSAVPLHAARLDGHAVGLADLASHGLAVRRTHDSTAIARADGIAEASQMRTRHARHAHAQHTRHTRHML